MRPRYVSLVLHAHLPYVVHHGTWPHGLDWLHEAAAETYLPLIRAFSELEQQGLASHVNLNISPILLEQLSHPTFRKEFPVYLNRKIEAARQDRREFAANGDDAHYGEVADFWQRFYSDTRAQWEALRGDIVAGFRHFYDAGSLEIITCGATHGFFPLLGTDNSIRAQVRTAVATHRRYFGRAPRGIWLPECGYRPRGVWQPPVEADGLRPTLRAGVEEILEANGIQYFFADTHLIEQNVRFSPYELTAGDEPVAIETTDNGNRASLYEPYLVDTPGKGPSRVTVFARDPRTGLQVWSGDHGYPGDPFYLDFHKKRWPGGLRYWQVTHPRVDLGGKTPYYPARAFARTEDHARHFADLCATVLDFNSNGVDEAHPPILSAPFDAELFGHWWFEGTTWIRHVVEQFAHPDSTVRLVSGAEYIDRHPADHQVQLPEGSWGSGGGSQVWLNPDNVYTWKPIYEAEATVARLAREPRLRSGEGERLLKQLCRELLLLESSDWQFLITTKHARDYAEKRFATHDEQFREILRGCENYLASARIEPGDRDALERIEARDNVFPDLNPDNYL